MGTISSQCPNGSSINLMNSNLSEWWLWGFWKESGCKCTWVRSSSHGIISMRDGCIQYTSTHYTHILTLNDVRTQLCSQILLAAVLWILWLKSKSIRTKTLQCGAKWMYGEQICTPHGNRNVLQIVFFVGQISISSSKRVHTQAHKFEYL